MRTTAIVAHDGATLELVVGTYKGAWFTSLVVDSNTVATLSPDDLRALLGSVQVALRRAEEAAR